MQILSTVTNGKLSSQARDTIVKALAGFEGKTVCITIGKPKRSKKQNSYWFAALDKYVVPIFRHGGGNWSSFKIHQMIMQELGYEDTLVKPDGTIWACRQHSGELDTFNWEEFMDKARAHLVTDYFIYVPLPNEVLPDQQLIGA